jgi:PLP dependent protein
VTPARDELVARVTANLAVVAERIATSGRSPDELTIVAVCKSFGPEAPAAAVAVGLHDVGENYASELVAHHDALGDVPLCWHFLGALQRNKLARLAPRVTVYESVASARDAEHLVRHDPGARCYVQVDVTGRPGRAGCAPGATPAVVAAAREAGLAVEGLMCVASPEPAAAAAEFASLRRSADALSLPGCSMGMSGDLELACRAGATVLRLGTALFGERASRPSATLA